MPDYALTTTPTDAFIAVKVFAWLFLTVALGIPIFLYVTKPRRRYRRSSRRARKQFAIGTSALIFIFLIFLILLAFMGDIFVDLIAGISL
jgi:glucan phosphoethanolaminetransferase (alkaline phosphatase superfamily)